MKENEFVTSDHHWGHANIIKYSKRPFKNVDEMNDNLVNAWNAKVPKGSIVYHLGDMAFMRPWDFVNLRKRLNGTIRLIRGNHDKSVDKPEVKALFEWIKPYYESTTDDGTKVVMCHYPFMTWNKSHHGSWNLHGHCHGSLKAPPTKRMDVGVDTNPNYAPYSFEEVKAYMDARNYQAADHHDQKKRI